MPMFRKVAKRGFSAGDYSAQKKIAIVNVGAFESREPDELEIVLRNIEAILMSLPPEAVWI